MFFGIQIRSLIGRRDWREDVSAYMDGELSGRDRARLQAQLAESAEMRAYLADLEEMRSVLRALEPAVGAAPFQLTTEMLNEPVQVAAMRRPAADGALRPTSTTRGLRLSMSTAALGVATFAAVMVFDAVDSPTVTFTATSAGDTQAGMPTATVVTDQAAVETPSQPIAQSAVQSTAQAAAPQPSRAEAAGAAQEQEADAPATVALVEAQEPEQSAAEDAGEAQAQQQAADDPSRRAITAGRGDTSAGGADGADAQSVTAEDVVQQQETASEDAELEQSGQAEPAAAAAQADSASSQTAAADDAAPALDDDQSQAAAQTQVGRRTVATSVRHSQSDWPLERRPRSSTIRLGRDPSWEMPVQIVLAAIAISATLLWLVLTIVDRRRRT